MSRLIRVSKHLGLLALAYLLVLAGTYVYCELAEPPGIRVDQAAKPLLSPAERAALHPDTRAGLEAYEAGDYTRAHTLWLPRAEAGDAEAMFGMGRIYGNGRGVEQDDVVARSWFEQAAELNNRNGLFNLGYFVSKGRGGSMDVPRAIDLYKRAVSLGSMSAANNLGYIFQNGVDVEQNERLAFQWYSVAAKQCHAKALVQLGAAYFDGINVTKNVPYSYTLTVLALLNGDYDRWKIHVLYLLYIQPWEYLKSRKAAWEIQANACSQATPIDIRQ